MDGQLSAVFLKLNERGEARKLSALDPILRLGGKLSFVIPNKV